LLKVREQGARAVPNQSNREYRVEVVSLGLGAQQEMRVALTVGDVQQIFRVSRAAPIVEATNPTVSNWVVTDEIVELVLNGRD